MSEQLPIVAPADAHLSHIQLTPADTPKQQPQVPAEVSAEQIHAVDEAFKGQEHSDAAAGLLMLWTSAPLLLELARDHFEEQKPEEKRGLPDDSTDS